MLNSLRITTLALGGVLLASTALTASAQTYSRDVSEPHVQQSANTASAPRAAAPASQSVGVNHDPVPLSALRGTEFDRPGLIAYSWGLQDVIDDHQAEYSWAEVNRRIGRR